MKRNYHFLTGATGLVGSYLLRNLLRAGESVVVLARPCKKTSAEQRIHENLKHWEKELGISLPAPKVIDGNLQDITWVENNKAWFTENCKSVIHCAASLTFYGHKSDEPWRSNIDGTKNILTLCKECNIKDLHYFSTAYVAGSAKHFYENQLDVGQSLRNDYEQSKFDAEKMVRGSDFIEKLTVYRPSIVVGDSQTAYTATFHGFYAVLKLAHTLVRRLPLGSTSGRGLLEALGVGASDRKNFIPVDWVADVFDFIFRNPEFHGKTYHMTSPEPPLLTDFVDVVQDAVETFSTLANEADPLRADQEWFFSKYLEEVKIYQAYLQDDPIFDSTNVQDALPNLPCPVMDKDLMMFLAKDAILSNFGKTRSKKSAANKNKTMISTEINRIDASTSLQSATTDNSQRTPSIIASEML
ncbi:MAG: SDR family oxidoreductase [Thermoguttaceae bacterium]